MVRSAYGFTPEQDIWKGRMASHTGQEMFDHYSIISNRIVNVDLVKVWKKELTIPLKSTSITFGGG